MVKKNVGKEFFGNAKYFCNLFGFQAGLCENKSEFPQV